MGHESSSEEEEENGRAKRRKRQKRRKRDGADVGLKSLEEVTPVGSELVVYITASFVSG